MAREALVNMTMKNCKWNQLNWADKITKKDDFSKILKQEEAYLKRSCDEITAFQPDRVIIEKGVSDLAQHFLNKAGGMAARRLRKSGNWRVARAWGATIVNKTDKITEDDIGTGAGLVEVRMIGDKCFTVLVQCKDPKDCTPLMRGVSKDILHEVKMNRQDALDGERNLYQRPSLVPGGGAMEKEVAHRLREKVKTMIKIARTQDEEVGDGTTSVIVLTAKMLEGTHQFLEGKRHPAGVIIKDTAATKINLEDASDGRGVI